MKRHLIQDTKTLGTLAIGAGIQYTITKNIDKYSGATKQNEQKHNELKEGFDRLNNRMDNLDNKVDNVNNTVNNLDNKVDNLNNSINNFNNNNDTSNFLPDFDFDFLNISLNSLNEYFDTLALSQVINIVHISSYILIFIFLIEIIGILFGNELIKYFNLENRFPKLAIFFKIRAKLQKYVLIWNFFIIFALCLFCISFNIFLFLYP